MNARIVLGVLLLIHGVGGCAPNRPEPAAARVPIIRERDGAPPELVAQARKLRDAGRLLAIDDVRKQLGRTSCRLSLPVPNSRPLTGSQIWARARRAHLRVGYFFLCNKCSNWHLNLAGGYAITADGAVATCFHVVEPRDMKEGYLLAATDDGKVLPVTAVLAGHRTNDACILRVASETPLEPLPLNPHVTPGDDVWCYSDPVNRTGFFSRGIVNRFYQHWHAGRARTRPPVRMNVSTDWAPGSSGAAVLDQYGNAVGHVVAVSARGEHPASGPSTRPAGETVIVFHDAVRAADVLALVKR
ncbi:MAG: trypsin-like peptidase domain-containing protein [Phycisphaerae bacterium]|jgi:hypothetical protein